MVVEAIVQDEVVRHPYAVRLHGVARAVVEVPDIWVIKIGHLRQGASSQSAPALPPNRPPLARASHLLLARHPVQPHEAVIVLRFPNATNRS